MNSDLAQILDAVARWVHVFAGIMWVGTTYFFTWLDGRFTELEEKANGAPVEPVWMVHSGGFYRVEKQKAPQLMPKTLHWFRWEAALTWLSGMFLFVVVYYMGGLLISAEDSPLSNGAAIGLSLGLLAAGWVAYDLLWRKIATNETVGLIGSFILVGAVAWLTTRYLTGRAAYLQLGAMFGTIMVSNVWMRILPAQRRMVAALKEGRVPDALEAKRAKAASKHNTFMAVPVVFIMISNHFPMTYGNAKFNWIILTALVAGGWIAAKLIRRA